MGSTRFPGKVLEQLDDRPVLEWVVRRAGRAELLDDLVVATSTSEGDDEIERWCSEEYVPCHRGPEEDVLARFHQVIEDRDPEIVTRLTADCPLLDPSICEEVIRTFLDCPGLDYVATGHRYPEGFGVEVVDSAALQVAHQEATESSDREHVTPFIWENPERFDVKRLNPEEDLSHFRATLDHPVDLEVLHGILENHPGPPASLDLQAVVGILQDNNDLAERNAHIDYQEGYQG